MRAECPALTLWNNIAFLKCMRRQNLAALRALRLLVKRCFQVFPETQTVGGDGWESNPPHALERVHGFEDQGSHQTPVTSALGQVTVLD